MVGLIILGVVDLLAAASFLFLKFGFLEHLAVFFMFFLIVKGLIFIKSFASIVDIICGVFLIMAYFGIYNIITWICFAWLLQKGFISLFSS
jgi:hypothetical protein